MLDEKAQRFSRGMNRFIGCSVHRSWLRALTGSARAEGLRRMVEKRLASLDAELGRLAYRPESCLERSQHPVVLEESATPTYLTRIGELLI